MHGDITLITNDRSTPTRVSRLTLVLVLALGGAAGSQTTHADVIYTPTPGLTIQPELWGIGGSSDGSPALLDLDGDGTIDITIASGGTFSFGPYLQLSAVTSEHAGVMVKPRGSQW